MCGLVGIYDRRGGATPEGDELCAMLATIRYRGPDEEGVWAQGPVGMAHARLSIIDPAGGQQPMCSADEGVALVFNGEIFNFPELRSELQARGRSFRSHSDTEVILQAYREYGRDFVDHLNGQFAIAIWDAEQQRLLLVRDRVGIHPLYFTEVAGRLLFGSEIKALLAVAPERRRLDGRGLRQVFTFWSPAGSRSLFDGVREVRPGEMLEVDARRIRHRRYWNWDYPVQGEEIGPEPLSSHVEELADTLADAARLRLRADVPVGAYLSGGLDSSLIAALIHQHSPQRLRTFSLAFSNEDLDESGFQSLMVKKLGTAHSQILCREEDVAAHWLEGIRHTEAPVLRTAPVPMMLLSRSVREAGFKVVLTGEGADETLGGYDLFKEAKIRAFWARNPSSAWRPRLLERLYPYQAATGAVGLRYLQAFYGEGLDDVDGPFFSHLPRWNSTASCQMFFADEWREAHGEDELQALHDDLPAGFQGWHPFHRAQYLEAVLLMPRYLLSSQGDRMLAANGVEGRYPFLDHRVVELANRLSPRLKMRVLDEKFILKQVARGRVPDAILQRPKQPYRAPNIQAFLGPASRDMVQELLSPRSIAACGVFDQGRVARLLDKALAGRALGNRDNMAFVGILSTQAWHQLFISGETSLN